MLSAESAIGAYPQKALSVLRVASERMESWSREESMQKLLPQHQLAVALPDRISEQICNCAVEMGNLLFSCLIQPIFSLEFSQCFFFKNWILTMLLFLQQTTLLWMPYLFTQSMVTWHHFYQATGQTLPYLRSLMMFIQERAWTSTGEWYRCIFHYLTAWRVTLRKPSAWWSQRVLWNLETQSCWSQTLI